MSRFTPLFVGVLLDLPDFLLAGLLPIIGDIIDVIGTFYFYRVLGPAGLVGAVELIPGIDILPTYTALGVYAVLKKGGTP